MSRSGPPSPGDAVVNRPCDREDRLLSFERAWRAAPTPRIEDFLPPPSDPGRNAILHELIAIDLEHRWRSRGVLGDSLGSRPQLEAYVSLYPELGPADQLPVALVAEEYRVRHCWGDRPSHAEFIRRFSRQGAALVRTLTAMDNELAVERAAVEPVQRQPVAPVLLADPVAAIATAGQLLDALRSSQILSTAQLAEAERAAQASRKPRGLARDLLQRGWLTPYQVNQLFLGRGAELALGPYVVLERIGEGGTGRVFKARHRGLQRVVALKLIRRELLTNAEIVSRFYREIEVAGRLEHPHLVRAYDAGPAGDQHFLAMEYLEGIDLGLQVKQSGPLPVELACEYIRQAAGGLAYIHERGLVHRDIKPSNLFLCSAHGLQAVGVIKILDLGLARLQEVVDGELTNLLEGARAGRTLTPVGPVMMGTPDYMAPEQALSFHRADIRADIYSLGCTFYYLLTGQPPFPGGTLAERLLRHQQLDPTPVEQLRPEVPKPVAALLQRMLAKKPEQRFQHPAEVAQQLSQGKAASLAEAPVGQANVSQRPRRLRRWLAVGSLLLATFFAALYWGVWHGPSSRPGGEAVPPATSLAQLTGEQIPDDRRYPDQPRELVAVLGKGGGNAAPRSLAISPDGKLVAAGDEAGVVHIWDPVTEKEVTVSEPSQVLGLAISPDGKTVASASRMDRELKAVRLWNPLTAGEISSFILKRGPGAVGAPPANERVTTRLLFSPDGKTLANGTQGGSVRLWDVSTGKERFTLEKHAGAIQGLAFAPDGRTLAVAATLGQAVKLWDPATGQERTTYPLPRTRVRTVAFAADSITLAMGGERSLSVWNMASGRELLSIKEAPAEVVFVSFAADGLVLVSAHVSGKILGWDTATGKKLWEWQAPAAIHDAAITADSRYLATANANATVAIFRLPRHQ